MAPGAHFLMSWILSHADAQSQRRDRVIVTLAGVGSDVDGLGLLLDGSMSTSGITSELYVKYHHVLAHNLAFACFAGAIGLALASAGRRWITAALAFLAAHLHIVTDLAGSKGSDGYQWPISYLYPFSDHLTLSWSAQWELAAWPNDVILGVLIIACVGITRYRGVSPLEVFSVRLDNEAHAMVRRYFVRKQPS